MSSTKNKGESWEKRGRAETYHCCRCRARWQLSWALKKQYATTPQKNKCERSKRGNRLLNGAGGGHLLFRAFPNLKSKPKILVLGLDYRTSFGLGLLMAFTLCEKNTVQLMFGLGRLVAFTLWKKNTVCPPHVWAPNDSDSNLVQIWCDWRNL
jgi:hypothetical protein